MGNSEKGFGFISPDDGSTDLFCHVSGLLDGDGSVQEGDSVSFNITFDERKGKDRATDVTSSGGGGRGGGGRGRSRSRDRGGGRDDRYGSGRDDRRGGGRDDRDYDRRR